MYLCQYIKQYTAKYIIKASFDVPELAQLIRKTSNGKIPVRKKGRKLDQRELKNCQNNESENIKKYGRA